MVRLCVQRVEPEDAVRRRRESPRSACEAALGDEVHHHPVLEHGDFRVLLYRFEERPNDLCPRVVLAVQDTAGRVAFLSVQIVSIVSPVEYTAVSDEIFGG